MLNRYCPLPAGQIRTIGVNAVTANLDTTGAVSACIADLDAACNPIYSTCFPANPDIVNVLTCKGAISIAAKALLNAILALPANQP